MDKVFWQYVHTIILGVFTRNIKKNKRYLLGTDCSFIAGIDVLKIEKINGGIYSEYRKERRCLIAIDCPFQKTANYASQRMIFPRICGFLL